ncbi:DUF1186 domain-containing protein [Mesorhizobium sp. VK25A]|uniref:DUF1186 domain-containing protein n=1 Tax=Mesorhizobium vachelliae TaxID=3072309 RepID=A0ABU5A1W6_9HYPH|nr:MULTISPECIES: DUF1186 domain-containing protein [unclassified Mesorhizobium]MDX8531661.1 DUF1186 domain-containing protein [Mesorhizobium sp. VK25D]MDX8543896.1 DUF1186 domain-containing protein [Mesorhizobium sp. VK25A]
MKKEELEKLLSTDSEDFTLYPIDRYLHALATERRMPDLAIGVCTIRIEEAAPALRAVLARAADGEVLSLDDERLLFRGLHILGGARDTEACQSLLRLLCRPGREVDDLLGDAITETLPRIFAGMFDGDAQALFNTIGDRKVDEFTRDVLMSAAAFLTWDGRIERDQMRLFLERFHAEKMAENEEHVWVGWIEAIAMLGWRDLAPLVDSAWNEGRVPDGVLERRDFEEDLRAAEEAPDDIERFKSNDLGYIDDVIETLDWFRHWEIDDSNDEEDWQSSSSLPWTSPEEPAINPLRHVGRNDPCPCGSGKKFKKCCLADLE